MNNQTVKSPLTVKEHRLLEKNYHFKVENSKADLVKAFGDSFLNVSGIFSISVDNISKIGVFLNRLHYCSMDF